MTRANKMQKALPVSVFVLAVFVVAVSMVAGQDGVKLSGMWVEPVKVHSIAAGQVRYQIASGRELVRAAESLEGLRLGRYPGLAQAQQAIDEGDDKTAVELLQGVMDQAEEPWVKWCVGMKLVGAHARLDDAEAAVDVYIDMVVSGAGLYFVADPPVDVVAQADVAVRARVLELVNAVVGAVGQERAALLEQIVTAAGNPAMPLLTETALPPGRDPSDTGLTHETNRTGEHTSPIVLSASVPPGTVANLYRRGRYGQALEVVEEALSQPGKTASKLYLKGMAQLALAERGDDQDMYKSAGLSFMRVVVYFPRSAVAGPAMLEAGYVHERIGRADIAVRLYQRARPLINKGEDPVYYQRLMKRIDSVIDAPTGE